MWVLAASAASIAAGHAVAPDHWVPFVALAQSDRWSVTRLVIITMLAGLGHVISSILLGGIGIILGMSLSRLELIESHRGELMFWALILFGVLYAAWSIRHARHRAHLDFSVKDVLHRYAMGRMWIMFLILVFGPCEPLVPLMFVAYKHGWGTVGLISAVFSLVTIAMIVGQSLLAYLGVGWVWSKSQWMERYAHTLAGMVIFLTAILVRVMGI